VGRKVRAPKSSVTANGRPSKDEDTEPQRRVEFCEAIRKVRVKRGNLYAEQDQIGPDLRVARPYCKYVSIGTGKVARSPEQSGGQIDDHLVSRRKMRDKTKLGLQVY
jgi:hypothetical protein